MNFKIRFNGYAAIRKSSFVSCCNLPIFRFYQPMDEDWGGRVYKNIVYTKIFIFKNIESLYSKPQLSKKATKSQMVYEAYRTWVEKGSWWPDVAGYPLQDKSGQTCIEIAMVGPAKS